MQCFALHCAFSSARIADLTSLVHNSFVSAGVTRSNAEHAALMRALTRFGRRNLAQVSNVPFCGASCCLLVHCVRAVAEALLLRGSETRACASCCVNMRVAAAGAFLCLLVLSPLCV